MNMGGGLGGLGRSKGSTFQQRRSCRLPCMRWDNLLTPSNSSGGRKSFTRGLWRNTFVLWSDYQYAVRWRGRETPLVGGSAEDALLAGKNAAGRLNPFPLPLRGQRTEKTSLPRQRQEVRNPEVSDFWPPGGGKVAMSFCFISPVSGEPTCLVNRFLRCVRLKPSLPCQ